MTERLSVSTALLRGKFLSLFELRPGALKFTILRPLISKLPISWSFLCIFMGRRSRRKGRLPSPPIPPSLGETNSFVVVQLLSPDSLRPHGLQQARVPCPSPSPGACSDSCPFRQWCHPTILSSVVPFSSCLQSFPTSGSFPMSRLFASGGQSIGASASASVLPMKIQDLFSLGLTGLISLQSKELSRVLQHHSLKHQFFRAPGLPESGFWYSAAT